MKTVAVLGGGPAGSSAAERLARAGLRTIIIDEKLAWEKPCGGGITYKAYSQYPYLIENETPKKLVTSTVIAAPKAGRVCMELNQPLVIYSRKDLNAMLLRRAEEAGAEIETIVIVTIEVPVVAVEMATVATAPEILTRYFVTSSLIAAISR